MSKICIIIGEGISERYFFPALIASKFGFVSMQEKQGHIYFNETLNVYWFFPFPPVTLKKEGKARLYSHETYRVVCDMIDTHAYLFQEKRIERHIKVIHDVDVNNPAHLKKCSASIDSAYKKSAIVVDSFDKFFVHNEIESWYIAGLDSDFPYFDRSKKREVEMLLSANPDEIAYPKESFENALNEEIKDSKIKIASACGEYMNVERAVLKSASFAKFISTLKTEGLI